MRWDQHKQQYTGIHRGFYRRISTAQDIWSQKETSGFAFYSTVFIFNGSMLSRHHEEYSAGVFLLALLETKCNRERRSSHVRGSGLVFRTGKSIFCFLRRAHLQLRLSFINPRRSAPFSLAPGGDRRGFYLVSATEAKRICGGHTAQCWPLGYALTADWATGCWWLVGSWATGLMGYWATGLLGYWATGLLGYWAVMTCWRSFCGGILDGASLRQRRLIGATPVAGGAATRQRDGGSGKWAWVSCRHVLWQQSVIVVEQGQATSLPAYWERFIRGGAFSEIKRVRGASLVRGRLVRAVGVSKL